jgi:hypothetical protein
VDYPQALERMDCLLLFSSLPASDPVHGYLESGVPLEQQWDYFSSQFYVKAL